MAGSTVKPQKESRFENYHNIFLKSKRPHLLMITNHGIHQWEVIPGLPDTGGQNVFVNQMTSSLVKHGFKVTIVNRGGYLHPNTGLMRRGLDYQDEFQRILFIEDGKKEFVRKEDMHEQIPELVNFLDNFFVQEDSQIDLIISHYWDAAKIGILFNERLSEKQKHIWIPHSVGALKKRNMDPSTWPSLRIDERIDVEKEIVKQVDDIGATSSAIKNALKNDYGYETELFLPPCIDTDRFHPADLSRDQSIWGFLSQSGPLSGEEIKKRKIITEISRTDDTKRKDVLIKAFAKLRKTMPDTALIVSIDDNKQELSQKLRKLITDLKVEDSVIAVGSVWDVLPKIYAVTDLYCTPSVMEGFGMAIQEAAASETPAVASDLVPFAVEYLLGDDVEEVSAGKGVLKKGEGAIVAPHDDVDAFAKAMELVLKDDKVHRAMAKKALDITIPYFTWDNLSREFLKDIGIELKPIELTIRHSFSRERLNRILRNEDIEDLSFSKICDLVRKEKDLENNLPEKIFQIDPRSGDRVLYNAKRAKRPHQLPGAFDHSYEEENPNRAPSIISKGKTTGVIDVADLSEGFTFINFNLFPILFPFKDSLKNAGKTPAKPNPKSMPVGGAHFLQWTSSYQDRDWHNMPLKDCKVVLERAAKLEESILKNGSKSKSAKRGKYVSMIKNCGALVGGSIAHGHQQIGFSTAKPRRVLELERFEKENGKNYAQYMLENNPEDLKLVDYGEALLIVPYFMRRPYDMQLILKDTKKSYLHELNAAELKSMAQGWKEGIQAMRAVLKGLGKEIAYNIVMHSGPGAGLFFEFLPYTQETGGFEHLGLYVCQGTPKHCVDDLKSLLSV